MTLILTALTPRHIVQVSDRRVVATYPSGRRAKLERHVKAIMTPHGACSYTGAANLGSSGDTAKWLATLLSDDLSVLESLGGMREIGDAIVGEFQRRRIGPQPIAVLFSFWSARSEPAVPQLVILANFDALPESTPPADLSTFAPVHVSTSVHRQTAVVPCGQPLEPSEQARVSRAVERLVESGRDTPRAIAQVLTEMIRSIARAGERAEYVSEDVLISSLPRPDLVAGSLVVGKLVDDWWSVTAIDAGETRAERRGGPLMVGDGAVIRTLEAHEGPPAKSADAVDAGFEIVRLPERGYGGLRAAILTNPPLGAAWGWPGGAGSAPPEEASAV